MTEWIKSQDQFRQALLAPFGWTAAVYPVERVKVRLRSPREPSCPSGYAGRELRPMRSSPFG